MKILMIAPEPVFRVRGTPFSVRDRCRALSELGHRVDLLTYPFGDDFDIPGVVFHRTRMIPGVKDVKIGFSWQKLPLDFLLFIKAILALKRTRYDLIHTHEEAGMMGAILGGVFKTPHLYDMHSSLPQQFKNYGTLNIAPVISFMNWAERFILKRSQAVIAICPHLEEIARESVPDVTVKVIENLAQDEGGEPIASEVEAFRRKHDLVDRFVVGYTGTFEVNQGLDLLVNAFARFHEQAPNSVLFLAGGTDDQIDRLRDLCRQGRIEQYCRFPGRIPPRNMSTVMAACDVLTSPRKTGTNTPLKLYSYLKSGVPILATDLKTHTQVLDREIAVLTAVSSDALASGLLQLYGDPELCRRLGDAARIREQKFYSYPVYKKKLEALILPFLPEQERLKKTGAVPADADPSKGESL